MKARSRLFETTVEVDDEEVEVTVMYRYTPGTPGQAYGPPENCYPPEGPEVDFEAIYLTGDATKKDIQEKLSEATMGFLGDRVCEEGEEAMDAEHEHAMELKVDLARERDL